MYCECALHCLHFYPRDGDLRSQGSQGRCHLGTRWWRDDLWQAGWGEANCSWKRAGVRHLPCLPSRFFPATVMDSSYHSECNVENGTKYSGYNLYPLGAETQEECAAACLREPECHFWTHNPNVGRCWLKKSDLGKGPSSKGSNSGQKSCGVTGERCSFGNRFIGSLFLQKTTSCLVSSLKTVATAPLRQQQVI